MEKIRTAFHDCGRSYKTTERDRQDMLRRSSHDFGFMVEYDFYRPSTERDMDDAYRRAWQRTSVSNGATRA